MDEDEFVGANPDIDPDDYDLPFADPQIRADYRDALGRFIMAHNEVDFWLAGILKKAVTILAPDGSLDRMAMGDFYERSTALSLLMKTAPHLGFGGVGKGRLTELNGTRNILAHGHFDQDPFDGTFEIVSRKHRSLIEKRLNNLNADTINAQAKELEDIARHMSAVFYFMDHPVPLEYLKDHPTVLKSAELWEMIKAEAAGPRERQA
jgi:hypothetical protein